MGFAKNIFCLLNKYFQLIFKQNLFTKSKIDNHFTTATLKNSCILVQTRHLILLMQFTNRYQKGKISLYLNKFFFHNFCFWSIL